MPRFEQLRDTAPQVIQNPADVITVESDIEQQLRAGRVIDIRRIYGCHNIVRRITIDGSAFAQPNRLAIYKSASGENVLSEWYSGKIPESDHKLYRRERAAYLISQAIGLDLVPTTIIREIEGEIGSVQEYIAEAAALYEVGTNGLEEQLYVLAIFDYLIWNKDRSGVNALVKDGKIFAIDNGLSIDQWPGGNMKHNLYAFVTSFRGSIPPQLIDGLSTFDNDNQAQEELRNTLIELEFPTSTINALFARIKRVTQKMTQGKFHLQDISQYGYQDDYISLDYYPQVEKEEQDLDLNS